MPRIVFPPRPGGPSAVPATRRGSISFIALVLWGCGVAAGFVWALVYENTPARTDAAAEQWPLESECPLAADRPTLVMFVHPRCPCSRASLDELAVLMTRRGDRLAAHVLFLRPRSAPDVWAETDLWRSAARIPGVAVRVDAGGVEQRRFGARVSGEVFLYAPSGGLSFHGGITAGRGHAGDNPGRSAIESVLLQHEPPAVATAVFGCELSSRTDSDDIATRPDR
ncbi:MAG: hypothetical protein WD069_20445 [Planctomycetales bacterium]